MNRLSPERRLQLFLALCGEQPLRAVARSAGVSINTVTAFLREAGETCARVHDVRVRAVAADQVVLFKGWTSITGSGLPQVCTWAAIEARTGLLIDWRSGGRDAATLAALLEDVGGRLTRPLPRLALDRMVAACADDEPVVLSLTPHASAEAATVTRPIVRTMGRRFSFAHNSRPRRAQHLAHLVAIYFVWSNFVWRRSGDSTAAMGAGLASRAWDRKDLSAVLEGQ